MAESASLESIANTGGGPRPSVQVGGVTESRPKLDPVVNTELGSQTKCWMAWAGILEQPEVAHHSLTESVGQALHYLVNANVNISRMRRKKVLKDLNTDLLSLADQADTLLLDRALQRRQRTTLKT